MRKYLVKLKPGPVVLTLGINGVKGEFYFIQIVGNNETLFYRIVDSKEKEVSINLAHHPKKVWVVVSPGKVVSTLQARLTYPKIPFLYRPEVKRPYPISAIRLVPNHHMIGPARMFVHKPVFEFHPGKMSRMIKPVREFIMKHELGHYYYNDERKADAFATVQHMNDGGNLSTATYALIHVLGRSPENVDRMIHQNEIAKYITRNYG